MNFHSESFHEILIDLPVDSLRALVHERIRALRARIERIRAWRLPTDRTRPAEHARILPIGYSDESDGRYAREQQAQVILSLESEAEGWSIIDRTLPSAGSIRVSVASVLALKRPFLSVGLSPFESYEPEAKPEAQS